MKKKKTVLFIVVLFVMLLCGFIGYKTYLLSKYKIYKDDNYLRFIEGLVNHDVITIKSNGKQDNVEYISSDGISLKNDYSDFTHVNEDITMFKMYVLYDEKKNFISCISFGEDKNEKVELIKSTDVVDSKVINKFLEKNNITNDMELLDYLIRTKDEKNNIFTSAAEIKCTYVIHYIMDSFASGSPVTYFEGDITGYMTKVSDKAKEVFVFKDKDGQGYYITFMGLDYFTDERILDVLENLVIN